jgi:hypothetical protein
VQCHSVTFFSGFFNGPVERHGGVAQYPGRTLPLVREVSSSEQILGGTYYLDVYYFVENSDGSAWTGGGNMFEHWMPYYNPCGYSIWTGFGPVGTDGMILDQYFMGAGACPYIGNQYMILENADLKTVRTNEVTFDWSLSSPKIRINQR